MFSLFSVPLLLVVAVLSVGLLPSHVRERRLRSLLGAAYVARVLVSTFVKDLPIFSYGTNSGGDSDTYEAWAIVISRYWSLTGFHYVTIKDFPELAGATLPQNAYATVYYLDDWVSKTDFSHTGCCALIAAVACICCVNLYGIAIELGASQRFAFLVTAIILFSPNFFYCTSDCYKDGFVALFEFGALGAGLRLSRKFSFMQLLVGCVSLLGLWLTRYYLVFVAVPPLLYGLLGSKSASPTRVVISSIVLTALALLFLTRSSLEAVADEATTALARGTSEGALEQNASSGSGIAVGSFRLKLLYTVLAPFPWQGGSVAFHLAKTEAFLWYYMLYRGLQSIRIMWRDRRSDLIIVLMFAVPATVAYSLTFSNVGLIFRQRIGIVIAFELLAAVTLTELAAKQGAATSRTDIRSRLLEQTGVRSLRSSR